MVSRGDSTAGEVLVCLWMWWEDGVRWTDLVWFTIVQSVVGTAVPPSDVCMNRWDNRMACVCLWLHLCCVLCVCSLACAHTCVCLCTCTCVCIRSPRIVLFSSKNCRPLSYFRSRIVLYIVQFLSNHETVMNSFVGCFNPKVFVNCYRAATECVYADVTT